MTFDSLNKSKARNAAKMIRAGLAQQHRDAGVELVRHWPDLPKHTRAPAKYVAAYIPIRSEIDVWPLMHALSTAGYGLALPCVKRAAHPLDFYAYTIGDKLRMGAFGTRQPLKAAEIVTPDIVLVPMLAFSRNGNRLGYGGGFYDRTLTKLRKDGEVFACGVAYSGQEVPSLPTDQYDQKLDGVLGETGYKDFTCA